MSSRSTGWRLKWKLWLLSTGISATIYGAEGSMGRTRGTRMMAFGQGIEESLQQHDYSHPYFWGAFILAGNWQPFRRGYTNL